MGVLRGFAGRPVRSRLAVLAVLTVLAALAGPVTAGCGAPTPTASPTPSASPSPSVSPPVASPSRTAPSTGSSVDGHAPPGFVAISDVDATILQDIRYATPHNFVGRPIDGYPEPLCILTRQAAEALHRVQTAARARGLSLKVYDCYRPQRAVDEFIRWSRDPADQQMKAEFYPRVDKSALFDNGYIGGPTAHSRGSTMDLTLVATSPASQRPYVPGEPLAPCYAPVGQRFPDNTVDMGTGFDCFDPLAHTLDPRVTGTARDNRLLLRQLMADATFTNYANEWWHYTMADEPFPRTYFNFPVSRAALTGG